MITVERFGEALLIKGINESGVTSGSAAIRRSDIVAIHRTEEGVSFVLRDARTNIDCYDLSSEEADRLFYDALLLGLGSDR